jgi:hypothetical protein
VRTHGDMFAWGGLSPLKEYQGGWSSWPRGLRELLESTKGRLNANVLAPNGFEAQLKAEDLLHVSTKKGQEYGVAPLWQRLTGAAAGPEGRLVALERRVAFLEQTVAIKAKAVNDAALAINRQWVLRKALNIAKMLLDPFFAIKQTAWSSAWLEQYKMDEGKHGRLLRGLEQDKAALEAANKELAALRSEDKVAGPT